MDIKEIKATASALKTQAQAVAQETKEQIKIIADDKIEKAKVATQDKLEKAKAITQEKITIATEILNETKEKATANIARAKEKLAESSARAIELLKAGKTQAELFFKDPDKIENILLTIEGSLKQIPNVGDDLADVQVIISMIISYAKKEYTAAPYDAIVYAFGAVISLLPGTRDVFSMLPKSVQDKLSDKLDVQRLKDGSVKFSDVIDVIREDIDNYREWRAEKPIE